MTLENKNIVREIQHKFCGASTEEKILKGIEEAYKLSQKEMIDYLIYVKQQMISIPAMRDMRNELKIKIGELNKITQKQ